MSNICESCAKGDHARCSTFVFVLYPPDPSQMVPLVCACSCLPPESKKRSLFAVNQG